MNLTYFLLCALTAPNGSNPLPAGAEQVSIPDGAHLSQMELAIWNDPAFKQRFAESYLAETDVEPSVTVIEREHLQEVQEKIASDKIDKARALLEKHNGEGSSAVFDFTLGNLSFQGEDFDTAAKHYRAAVAKHPRFRRAWGNLALIYVRGSDYKRAAEAFTRVISLGGGDAIQYGLLGFAYSSIDNHIAAESAYRMALLLDPGTMDWKRGLARSFFQQRRFADAVALCGALIAEQPQLPEFWLLQANAFIGLKQPMAAAECYEVVDRLGGATPDSQNNLGDIYVTEELFDLAVEAYGRALRLEETGTPVRALRAAKVLASRGELAATGRLVEQIEATCSDRLGNDERKDLLKLRARIAVANGAGAEEARVLEEIVALDPLDGEALILLGKHARRAGELERAAFYYERAASQEAFEADAKVAHAQLLVGEGKYAEALPMLQRAQLLRPRENVQQYLEQVERISQNR